MRGRRHGGRGARALVPLLAVVLLVASGLAGEARATGSSFTVADTADGHDATPGDGVCTTAPTATPASVCTLRAALEEADALGGADTVSVPAGSYTLSLGQLRVTSPDGVTVTGAGRLSTALVGSGDRVLEIADGAQATVSGVEITGGSAQSVTSGPFTVDSGGGGGVRVIGSLNLQDVDVDANQEVGNGGGGGIAVIGAGTLAMTGGSVVSNTSANGVGGGVLLRNSSVVSFAAVTGTPNASFDGTTVASNVGIFASGIGFDGVATAPAGTLTLTNAHVDGNGTTTGPLAGDCSVGLLAEGSVTVSGGTVDGNCGGGVRSSGTVAITGAEIAGNAETGVSVDGGTLDLTDSTVDSNASSTVAGISNSATLTVTRSSITDNASSGSIGGLFNQGPATLTNVTLSGNTAGAGGHGGIYANLAASLTVVSSTVTDNGPDGIDVTGGGSSLALTDTIVAKQRSGADCGAAVSSGGHNLDSDGSCGLAGPGDLSGVDPLLGPLAANGGPTKTHALGPPARRSTPATARPVRPTISAASRASASATSAPTRLQPPRRRPRRRPRPRRRRRRPPRLPRRRPRAGSVRPSRPWSPIRRASRRTARRPRRSP